MNYEVPVCPDITGIKKCQYQTQILKYFSKDKNTQFVKQ